VPAPAFNALWLFALRRRFCEGRSALAKRPRYSRWRRLPQVYRSGEFKLPVGNSEPQRLTLYLAESLLDAAEAQAKKAGVNTVQEYCANLLANAIEAERIREHVADVESRRGPLEGLHEIANDQEYLAEWRAQVEGGERHEPPRLNVDMRPEPGAGPFPSITPIVIPVRSEFDASWVDAAESPVPPAATAEIEAATRVVLFHAGQSGDDPAAFLPCLRRGMSVTVAEIAELARALQLLEVESRDDRVIDRRLAFALHRLAYEGQILHTDAWPGAFDEWTVDALRAVQEVVERILSGQDIRYNRTDSGSENPR
jgi:hypothetical protein